MTREALRLLWQTVLASLRHRDPPLEHPGTDEQFARWHQIDLKHAGKTDSRQADEDDRRPTP